MIFEKQKRLVDLNLRLAPMIYFRFCRKLAAFFVFRLYLKSEMMLTIRLAPEIAKLIIWYFVIDITSPLGGKPIIDSLYSADYNRIFSYCKG